MVMVAPRLFSLAPILRAFPQKRGEPAIHAERPGFGPARSRAQTKEEADAATWGKVRQAQAAVRAHQAQRDGTRPFEQGRRAHRGRDDEQDAPPEGRDEGVPQALVAHRRRRSWAEHARERPRAPARTGRVRIPQTPATKAPLP